MKNNPVLHWSRPEEGEEVEEEEETPETSRLKRKKNNTSVPALEQAGGRGNPRDIEIETKKKTNNPVPLLDRPLIINL